MVPADQDKKGRVATTLRGSVVTQVPTIASSRPQIARTVDLLASDQKNLKLTQRMLEVRTAAKSGVLIAESRLASDQTTMSALLTRAAAA
ncbi:MAG: hypothetical protein ACLQJ0_08000 [Steroidobacteraceae bacterium]